MRSLFKEPKKEKLERLLDSEVGIESNQMIDPHYTTALTGEKTRKVSASFIATSFFNAGKESLSSQPFSNSKSVCLFTGFFTVHSNLSEGGKQVAPYLTGRDRQSLACVNTTCYRFFSQLPPIINSLPFTHLPEEEKGGALSLLEG